MNDKLKDYIAYHDNKIKNAMIKRDKNKRQNLQQNLSNMQRQKLLTLLNYIRYNPNEALKNKETLKAEIKKILSN